jgi:hypothetical protein
MRHRHSGRGRYHRPIRPVRRHGEAPNNDPWTLGVAWGPLSPFTTDERRLEEFRREPWSASLLRRVVEEEAEHLGLDIDGLFRMRRAEARHVVRRLGSTGVLTLEDCEAVGMLLLILSCRDSELPEAGRRHAISLLAATELRQRRNPRAPTASEFVGATWTALSALADAGVVEVGGWVPGEVVFDGECVKESDYQPVVMAPEIGPEGVVFAEADGGVNPSHRQGDTEDRTAASQEEEAAPTTDGVGCRSRGPSPMKRNPHQRSRQRPASSPEERDGAGDPIDDPWRLGLDWGPVSPPTDIGDLREEIGHDPWTVSLLRHAVEGEADRLGLDIDGFFRKLRREVQAAVDRLASTAVLTPKDAEDTGMLLLMVTCRDPMLPETGRRHAMGLISAVGLRQARDPQAPTAAELVGATWTALRSLGGTAVVNTDAWTPGDVVFDGERVKHGEYRPLVMTPGDARNRLN